jgi:hypothetical protein
VRSTSHRYCALTTAQRPLNYRGWPHRRQIRQNDQRMVYALQYRSRIGENWAVSRVALAMLLDGNREALLAYLAGDRSCPTVTGYFARFGVPLPKPLFGFREEVLSEVKTRVEAV